MVLLFAMTRQEIANRTRRADSMQTPKDGVWASMTPVEDVLNAKAII